MESKAERGEVRVETNNDAKVGKETVRVNAELKEVVVTSQTEKEVEGSIKDQDNQTQRRDNKSGHENVEEEIDKGNEQSEKLGGMNADVPVKKSNEQNCMPFLEGDHNGETQSKTGKDNLESQEGKDMDQGGTSSEDAHQTREETEETGETDSDGQPKTVSGNKANEQDDDKHPEQKAAVVDSVKQETPLENCGPHHNEISYLDGENDNITDQSKQENVKPVAPAGIDDSREISRSESESSFLPGQVTDHEENGGSGRSFGSQVCGKCDNIRIHTIALCSRSGHHFHFD